MEKNSKIYVAGHMGLVGSAITRALKADGFNNLVLKPLKELDLMDHSAVADFFSKEKPEYVFLAAAMVGGIQANAERPAEFIMNNLTIQNNVIAESYKNGVKKLLFLGSSCIYPRECPQPIKEEYLLTGPLEKTNDAYAVAKIAGIMTCQSYNKQYGTNYISVMPTNLYGPNDNFDLNSSHVLPALIRKFDDAKKAKAESVEMWGTGKARREFLYVDDLADAVVYLMKNYDGSEIVNIGTGIDLTIQELAEMIKGVVGFDGVITHDTTKPDGTPQKLLDVSRLHKIGWKHKVELQEGLKRTYEAYLAK